MDIGFIGLGQMGFHMARRLVEAGHRLVVFDTRREASTVSPRSERKPPAHRARSPMRSKP